MLYVLHEMQWRHTFQSKHLFVCSYDVAMESIIYHVFPDNRSYKKVPDFSEVNSKTARITEGQILRREMIDNRREDFFDS